MEPNEQQNENESQSSPAESRSSKKGCNPRLLNVSRFVTYGISIGMVLLAVAITVPQFNQYCGSSSSSWTKIFR